MIGGALIASFLWTNSVTVINDSSGWLRENIGGGEEEHALSGGVVFAIVMFIFATDLLLSPTKQAFGGLIGYGPDGIPIFNTPQPKSQSLVFILRSSLRDILAESDSRNIFYFLCINLVSCVI
jgi:zinc transporter 5/7